MDPYTMALIISSVLITMAMAPKPTMPKPATFDAFDLPQVEEGTPQAVVFGEAWTGDWQVIGKGNFRTERIRASSAKK